MAPQPVISLRNGYYPAQKMDKRILPLLFEGELPYADKHRNHGVLFTGTTPFQHAGNSLDLVSVAKETNISAIVPSSWFEGYDPWISLFERLVDESAHKTTEINATHFSLDSFAATIWLPGSPETYYGLELGARLNRYVRKNSLS